MFEQIQRQANTNKQKTNKGDPKQKGMEEVFEQIGAAVQ